MKKIRSLILACALVVFGAVNSFAVLVDNDGVMNYSALASAFKGPLFTGISTALAIAVAVTAVYGVWKLFKRFVLGR